MQIINLSTLPQDILQQIPLSIRTFKKLYAWYELPSDIQELIKTYYDSTPSIKYSNVYDFIPTISRYSDFTTIENKVDLVVEYLKNYLLILPESYPFDPNFGCRLKYHLQTKDTNLRQTLISAEIDNLINILTVQFDIPITINSITMNPIRGVAFSEYNIKIDLQISDYHKSFNFEFR